MYTNRLPNLSDDAIYTYELKYFGDDSGSSRSYSAVSTKIRVPVFAKYTLNLQSPSNNTSYSTMPSSIDFSWQAQYKKSIINSYLTSSANVSSADEVELTRRDTFYIREVVTNNLLVGISYNLPIANTDETYTISLSTETENKPKLAGKYAYWTVTSELVYIENKYSSEYYYIIAKSYPTISAASAGYTGNAHNGAFYINF